MEPQAEATSDPVLTRTSRPRCTERHHTVMSETLAPPGCPVSPCTHSSHIPRDLTVRVQRDSTERLRGRRQNCRIRKNTHTQIKSVWTNTHICVFYIRYDCDSSSKVCLPFSSEDRVERGGFDESTMTAPEGRMTGCGTMFLTQFTTLWKTETVSC